MPQMLTNADSRAPDLPDELMRVFTATYLTPGYKDLQENAVFLLNILNQRFPRSLAREKNGNYEDGQVQSTQIPRLRHSCPPHLNRRSAEWVSRLHQIKRSG